MKYTQHILYFMNLALHISPLIKSKLIGQAAPYRSNRESVSQQREVAEQSLGSRESAKTCVTSEQAQRGQGVVHASRRHACFQAHGEANFPTGKKKKTTKSKSDYVGTCGQPLTYSMATVLTPEGQGNSTQGCRLWGQVPTHVHLCQLYRTPLVKLTPLPVPSRAPPVKAMLLFFHF